MKSVEKLFLLCFLFEAVLCGKFSIVLPKKIEAMSGTCVLIPCSFQIKPEHVKNLQETVSGLWLKDGYRIKNKVFNSTATEGNKIEGKITGDLLMKNCTTIFYNITQTDSGDYYFRLEGQGRLKHTYNRTKVSINVTESPPRPSITLYKEDQGEVEGQNEVVEGSSVSLICSARASCPSNPPIFTWSLISEAKRQEQNQNSSFSSTQLNFRASHLHHGYNVTCSTSYHLHSGTNTSAQSSLMLQVLYAPKNVIISVFPSASVLLGGSVSLRCSTDANPAVLNYTWYRENGELVGTEDKLVINQTDQKHHGLYYCRAHNQHGDQNSSIFLDIQYAPQISLSSGCNSSQKSIDCFCEVHGNPSPTLEWFQSGQKIPSSETMQSEIYTGFRRFISIPQSRTNFLPTLQCVATNQLGVSKQSFCFMSETQSSAAGLHLISMLIGAAAGALLTLLVCLVYLCVRKRHPNPTQSEKENAAGLILNDRVQFQEEDGVLSESLHYSTINFPNGAGNKIRGLSSLTAEYAAILHHSKDETEHDEEEESGTNGEVQKQN